MIYTESLAAVWWGEKKSASYQVLLRHESRWSEIERGDIADKGDIVWDADDSQAGEETISACDCSCLKPSPTLFLSDLLLPLPLHLFLLASVNRPVTLLYFSHSGPSGLVWIACPLFRPQLSLSGHFSLPFLFISLQSTKLYSKDKHALVIRSCVSMHIDLHIIKHTPIPSHRHTHICWDIKGHWLTQSLL